MKKNVPPTFLESLANELVSKYRRLDTILTHAPSKGSYHEKILRDVIRNYLPNSFSTGEGFIINKQGETSSQMDIMCVDNMDPRSFGYKDNDFYVASNIAVTCFGEVKTYCTKKEFITSFHNLINASLVMGDQASRCTSFFFCYDAYATQKTFNEWTNTAMEMMPNKNKLDSWNYPDYVFCLQKKIMLERVNVPGGFHYKWTTSKSNAVQQVMIESLIQCVTNGCSRIRIVQGIQPLSE